MLDLKQFGLVQDDLGVWYPADTDDHAISYPQTGHAACFEIEDQSFWFAHRNACITAALHRYPIDGPLVDVGGGNGAVSAALEAEGIATVVVEPGAEGAHNSRRRGLPNVVCSTLSDAGFDSTTFGAAGLFDVVEHVLDDAALLRSVHRVLRPGGVLCLTVPAYQWLWSAEDDLAGHFRRYTLRGATQLVERSGFDVRYSTYLFWPLVAPTFLLRSIPSRLSRRAPSAVEKTAARQHVPSAISRVAIDALLAPELRQVRAGRTVPLGTTCLVVAERQ